MGQKPLYYGYTSEGFVFASELKAIERAPGFARDVDRDVLALYLRHGYVPDPHCIWRGLRKQTPGTCLRIHPEDIRDGRLPDPEPYWRVSDAVSSGAASPIGDPRSAVDDLERLLSDAVGKCMVSDVPLGAFLSGGIDSSMVTALMPTCWLH